MHKHGYSDFAGVTEKLRALHFPRLITMSNDFNSCLLLFRSHDMPESWQAQVHINIVGLSIDLEGLPCLKEWINLLAPFFELYGPSWVKVASSV